MAECDYDIIIQIETKEGYDEIINILDKMGYRWGAGNSLRERIFLSHNVGLYVRCGEKKVLIDESCRHAIENKWPHVSFERFLKPMIGGPNLNGRIISALKGE